MKKIVVYCFVFFAVTGCATRSISNSGYQGDGYYGGHTSNPLYKGELSEFAVLGIDAGKTYSDAEIERQFKASADRIALQKGDSILLIQSGAMIPDEAMIDNFQKYFRVVPFSGVPEPGKDDNASYASGLRLAAAKAGIDKIIAYWGVLESGVEALGTKTVSWFPIIGGMIPDESQRMRIRLKLGIVDVRTGRWELFVPRVFADDSASARYHRASADQKQVESLKVAAYAAATEAVLHRFER